MYFTQTLDKASKFQGLTFTVSFQTSNEEGCWFWCDYDDEDDNSDMEFNLDDFDNQVGFREPEGSTNAAQREDISVFRGGSQG